jgi:predicted lysophospholipase L1 biosynthesis ABC-type transport system permease subunit
MSADIAMGFLIGLYVGGITPFVLMWAMGLIIPDSVNLMGLKYPHQKSKKLETYK